MPILYLDASAIVKLILSEQASDELDAYTREAMLVTSEIILTEVPRAIRRACQNDPLLSLADLLDGAENVLERHYLVPTGREILTQAGALGEASLRALDAIHIATAIEASPVDAFVTYDDRQAAAARLTGLRTVAPGS